LIALLAFAISHTATAGINFSATVTEQVFEGMKYQQLAFRDDKGTITVDLPPRWTYRSAPERLQLQTGAGDFAEGLIEAVPAEAPRPLEDADVAAFEAQVLASVPAGAQDVAVVARERNPIPVGGDETFEIVVRYKTLGYTFLRSTLLVNRAEDRLICRFTARESDFRTLSVAFRRVLQSWSPSQPREQSRGESPVSG
jgi:hypothetical protein